MKPLLLFLLILLGLAGCAGVEKPRPELPGTTEEQAQMVEAQEWLAEGEYARAAGLYSRLAQGAEPPRRYEFELRAADALARGELIVQARERLARIPLSELGAALQLRGRLVQARILLQERRPDEVLGLLDEPEVQVTDRLMADFHGLRADAHTMRGDRIASARALVWREIFLDDPDAIRANQYAIWQTLGMLSEHALDQLRTAPPPDVLSGWMELVRTVKLFQLEPQEMQQRLHAWQRSYPSHPVLPEILDSLIRRPDEGLVHPEHIALILPFSGRFAPAADAVRDGFVAAYYARGGENRVEEIRLYDAGGNPTSIYSVYQQAVRNGAKFVVGPLDKKAVDVLAQMGRLPVPTLALNYANVDSRPPAGLYQFGLSPEEEARQLAERTWLDGHVYAAALYPSSAWGKRVYEAFQDRWEQLGGEIVSHQDYDASQNDFSGPIRRLLNIDASDNRHRALARTMGANIEFNPRRRQDIDFIFVAAYPRQARQIRPQLRYHHAADLPVYATSHVYTGEADPTMDRDMNGLFFGDMPWVLGQDQSGRSLRARVEPHLSSLDGGLHRLYALGVDAFNLIALLDPLARYPYERYQGETGSLSLDAQNRVRRELTWTRFKSGRPVPVERDALRTTAVQ